ncbi:hypothetical protein JCM10212_000536 [Sporobolomyces blumeae]
MAALVQYAPWLAAGGTLTGILLSIFGLLASSGDDQVDFFPFFCILTGFWGVLGFIELAIFVSRRNDKERGSIFTHARRVLLLHAVWFVGCFVFAIVLYSIWNSQDMFDDGDPHPVSNGFLLAQLVLSVVPHLVVLFLYFFDRNAQSDRSDVEDQQNGTRGDSTQRRKKRSKSKKGRSSGKKGVGDGEDQEMYGNAQDRDAGGGYDGDLGTYKYGDADDLDPRGTSRAAGGGQDGFGSEEQPLTDDYDDGDSKYYAEGDGASGRSGRGRSKGSDGSGYDETGDGYDDDMGDGYDTYPTGTTTNARLRSDSASAEFDDGAEGSVGDDYARKDGRSRRETGYDGLGGSRQTSARSRNRGGGDSHDESNDDERRERSSRPPPPTSSTIPVVLHSRGQITTASWDPSNNSYKHVAVSPEPEPDRYRRVVPYASSRPSSPTSYSPPQSPSYATPYSSYPPLSTAPPSYRSYSPPPAAAAAAAYPSPYYPSSSSPPPPATPYPAYVYGQSGYVQNPYASRR